MVGNPSPWQEEAHSIFDWEVIPARGTSTNKKNNQLDPVVSTVRYEVMKLCTGSVILTQYRTAMVGTG